VVLAGCGRVAFDPTSPPDSTPDGTAPLRCGNEVSLVACFPFDGDANDTSGYAHHATGPVTYVPGRRGNAAVMGAATDLRLPDTTSFDFATAVTVMTWLRLEAAPSAGRGVIIDRNDGFALWVDSVRSPALGLALDSGTFGLAGSMTIPLQTWVHVAATFDGTTINVYLDGMLRGSVGVTPGAIRSDNMLGTRIGGNLPDVLNTMVEALEGQLDELAVWSEALPAARIECVAAGTC
jgi:hypothetical protein